MARTRRPKERKVASLRGHEATSTERFIDDERRCVPLDANWILIRAINDAEAFIQLSRSRIKSAIFCFRSLSLSLYICRVYRIYISFRARFRSFSLLQARSQSWNLYRRICNSFFLGRQSQNAPFDTYPKTYGSNNSTVTWDSLSNNVLKLTYLCDSTDIMIDWGTD